jgi:hypothetical protein
MSIDVTRALRLEGCASCEHRTGRFCAAVDLGRMPPLAWRHRGVSLVPTWCPLGDCACGDMCRLALPDGSCATTRAEDGPMSQADIGALLGLTQQSVAHIEAKALRKVRAARSPQRLMTAKDAV